MYGSALTGRNGKIGKGIWLFDVEKGTIDEFLRDNESISETFLNSYRKRYAVRNCINKKKIPEQRGLAPLVEKDNCKGSATDRKCCRKLDMISGNATITTDLSDFLRIVQRELANHEHMEYKDLQARPKLEPRHDEHRLE